MWPDVLTAARSQPVSKPEPTRILVLFGSAVIYGAERGNLEALMALRAQGAEILCLIRDETWNTIVPPALDARGIAWLKVPYVEQWRRSRAHVVLLRGPWAWITANWRFLKAMRDFKPTHIHTYGQLFVANFALGLTLVRTPLVFRAGDEPILHNAFWRGTWRYVVRRTAKFVANAEFVARSLRASGVPSEQITVIYNVPPSRPDVSQRRLTLHLPQNARVFAYIGQIAEHKGPHILVAAFRKLVADFPNIHLLLAGRISAWVGDAWARDLRDATLQDRLIGQRVTFLGEIEDVPTLLERCEAVVVPSMFDDPSPNVVMEAKQAGRAAIVFPRGGLPELIDHGIDGLICREATEVALVDSLLTYFSDAELSAKHGAAALATSGRFGNADFGKRWADIYSLGSICADQFVDASA